MKRYVFSIGMMIGLLLGQYPEIKGASWMSDEGNSVRDFVVQAQEDIQWAVQPLKPFITKKNCALIAVFSGLSVGVWFLGNRLIDRAGKR